MPSSRLAAVIVLLSSCAAWETTSPTYTAPPAEGPTPSHYAPPPNEPPPNETPEPPTETPEPQVVAEPKTTKGPPGDHIAIASVQLANDCPDPPAPAAAAAPSPEASSSRAGPAGRPSSSADMSMSQSKMTRPGFSDCDQSTVQIGVRTDRPGTFRIEAVRILDGARKRVAGTSTLRLPTQWRADSSTYQAWDAAVPAETDLQISYKLGELDLTKGEKLVGPHFNTFFGPFLLELDVSIDGRRKTIRSSQFAREMPDMAIQT